MPSGRGFDGASCSPAPKKSSSAPLRRFDVVGARVSARGLDSDAFFRDFKDAAGGSGLKFKIYQEGSGPKPVTGQKVFIDYAGYLLDGTAFDASEAGKPFKFRLGKGKVRRGVSFAAAAQRRDADRRAPRHR